MRSACFAKVPKLSSAAIFAHVRPKLTLLKASPGAAWAAVPALPGPIFNDSTIP